MDLRRTRGGKRENQGVEGGGGEVEAHTVRRGGRRGEGGGTHMTACIYALHTNSKYTSYVYV
jgi:hypothetical protein